MRHVLDSVLIRIIGQVNRLVFVLSRGRVILYRSFGFPGRVLTLVGPQGRTGKSMLVSCLPDQDDYIVMVSEREDSSLREALETCTAASMECGNDWVAVDVAMLSDRNERSTLLRQLMRRASIAERREVVQHHLTPLARIRLRTPPSNEVSVAFSGI